MNNFKIEIDVKCTVWERATWVIEAKNEEEATAQARKIWLDQTAAYELKEYMGVSIVDNSHEYIAPDENDGQPTEELLLEGISIINNVNMPV